MGICKWIDSIFRKKKKEKIVFYPEFIKPEEYKDFLDSVNKYRIENGVPPVSYEYQNEILAKIRTKYMISQGKATHSNFLVDNRFLKNQGIVAVGENIAFGYRNLTSTLRAWQSSDGHRANMLKEDWKYTGVSMKKGLEGYYYCQIFSK